MPGIIDVAERLLQVCDPGVALEREAEVLAVHDVPTVIRTEANGLSFGSSVIVKGPRQWAPYDPSDAGGPASGVFAEAAALTLIDEIWPGNGRVPRLLAADRAHGVLVIEDLGTGPTLEDALCGSDAAVAARGVIELAEVLAEMHSRTMAAGHRYRLIRDALGPASDDRAWRERIWTEGIAAIERLGLRPQSTAAAELEAVHATIMQPSLAALCQAEPGDGNVLVRDGAVGLIDFEGSYWGHPGCDAAFPRTAFGHLPSPYRLPNAVVANFEDTYRNTLTANGSELATELQTLASGSLWIALSVLATAGSSVAARTSTEIADAELVVRQRLSWQWQQVAHQAAASTPLRQLATSVLERLADLWDTTCPDPPLYPAFRSPSGTKDEQSG